MRTPPYVSCIAATILLLIISVFPLYSVTETQGNVSAPSSTPTVDSLLNIMESASGPELLKLHPRLHKALYEVNDPDVHLRYNDEFAQAAKAAKDRKAESIAAVLRIEALYNYRASDSVLMAEALRALDIMRGVPGAEVHYFFTAAVVSDAYMLAGNYEEALKTAEKFYEEAKAMNNNSGLVASLQTMGKAYEELGVLDKAETSLRESITAADETTDTGLKGESYSYLLDMLNGQGRHEEALEASREFEDYLERINAYDGELKNLCFMNYLGFASSYTKLGQYEEAERYLAMAEAFPVAQTEMGMYSVENERFALLLAQGRYAEAQKSLDILEDILGEDASAYQAQMRVKEARADLHHRRGSYREAADAYREYILHKDSMQRVELTEKLHALRTRYEVDKLEMQREQQRRSFRTTVVWLSVALVLLVLIIVLVVLNARRLHQKNRSLLERIEEQDKLEQNNEQLRRELALKEISASPEDDEDSSLYFRLRELMKDPTVFTDPDITRKIIAEKLGTNEKYVFDTIRQYYGMTISDYIANLRLNYARELLARPSAKYTIEGVALDAGFTNRITFHRLFKERYGMTPAEFRRLVADS